MSETRMCHIGLVQMRCTDYRQQNLDADEKCFGRYRKMHIPDDPLFYVKFYFTPVDLGFQVFETRCGCLRILICWGQSFDLPIFETATHFASILA
jgi:N-carbamoylputrescine amidase